MFPEQAATTGTVGVGIVGMMVIGSIIAEGGLGLNPRRRKKGRKPLYYSDLEGRARLEAEEALKLNPPAAIVPRAAPAEIEFDTEALDDALLASNEQNSQLAKVLERMKIQREDEETMLSVLMSL